MYESQYADYPHYGVGEHGQLMLTPFHAFPEGKVPSIYLLAVPFYTIIPPEEQIKCNTHQIH